MKYLECLRTVFGGGSAAPPDDAAAALARGAKRLRTVIETETRAGQALAASWAGAANVSGHSHDDFPSMLHSCQSAFIAGFLTFDTPFVLLIWET